MDVKVIFENENLILVDKPAGCLTTPARLADDPRPVLGRVLQRRMNQQIYPVHRLDFEVSGLTVFAKKAESHRVAQAWFEKGQVKKIYAAFSSPGPQAPPLEVEEWLSRLVRGKRRSFVAPHGKPSTTRARVVKAASDHWEWELEAVTGRPHQLRVEMALHGTPIFGDVLYGGLPLSTPHLLALRALSLGMAGLPEAERLGLPESVTVEPLMWNETLQPVLTVRSDF